MSTLGIKRLINVVTRLYMGVRNAETIVKNILSMLIIIIVIEKSQLTVSLVCEGPVEGAGLGGLPVRDVRAP